MSLMLFAAIGWCPPSAAPKHCRGTLLAAPSSVHMLAPKPTELERRERMKQLFGEDYVTQEERELGRVQGVEQPQAPEAPPEWMTLEREFGKSLENRARRLTLWLEDRGVDMSQVLVVPADGRLAVVTGCDVKVGEVLFEIPDDALLTALTACNDPDVRTKNPDVVRAS
jgi:hypothetical protein